MDSQHPLATALVDHSAPSHRCPLCYTRGLLQRANDLAQLNQREVTSLDTELARVRRELALSEARRLTLEILRAIERNDRAAWSEAVQARAGLCISAEDLEAIQGEYARKEAA